MQDSASKPGFSYLYIHDKTDAATGYFSCRAEHKPDLATGLRWLAQFPMDSFLHSGLLKDVGSLEGRHLRQLANFCLTGEALKPWAELAGHADELAGIVAELLLESATLSQECACALEDKLAELRSIAGDSSLNSPLYPVACRKGKPSEEKGGSYYSRALKELLPIDLAGQYAPSTDLEDAIKQNLLAFEKQKGLLRAIHKNLVIPEKTMEQAGARETAELARERLERTGLLQGPEMRHEASLSPIALLRQWKIKTRVAHGRHRHTVKGLATAYGRGLSLAQARASCLMEIVERACAYVSVKSGGEWDEGEVEGLCGPSSLRHGSAAELREKGFRIIVPGTRAAAGWEQVRLYWLEGFDAAGKAFLAPAQAVFLFLNLDEPDIFDYLASTGLASGSSLEGAKLAALTEVLERDANSTSPYDPAACFVPMSRDEKIQSLLDDYKAKRIFIYMQDISNEAGFPVYRSIVRDLEGKAFFSTGANLEGKKAALSALTETPWPYSWSSPFPSSKACLRLSDRLPVRYLEDLPNFSFGRPETDLLLLEKLLEEQGRIPIYVNIGRKDLGFPVVRAFIPDMEASCEYDSLFPPGPRLFARLRQRAKMRGLIP